MRAFTYSDAKSHKFWNIELQGDKLTVTFGRVGSAGQTQTKTYGDEARARKEHDKLVKEKLAKGYQETAPAPAPSATQSALERALVEAPDDLAAHSAYADYLSEQGDPRGELIQAQLALEDQSRPAGERKKLQEQEKKLLQAHARDWLGELAPFLLKGRDRDRAPRYQFARGWLDSLEISALSLSLSRALAKAPQARLLRRLVIETVVDPEEDEVAPGEDEAADVPAEVDEREAALWPLVKSASLQNVRVFQLGEQADDKVLELQYGEITDEGARALAACPDLRNLELLDLSHNNLTQAGRKALAAVPIQVRADDQFREPGEALMYGDME
jgi:uncharacterized protein (TIGR02996 family)